MNELEQSYTARFPPLASLLAEKYDKPYFQTIHSLAQMPSELYPTSFSYREREGGWGGGGRSIALNITAWVVQSRWHAPGRE